MQKIAFLEQKLFVIFDLSIKCIPLQSFSNVSQKVIDDDKRSEDEENMVDIPDTEDVRYSTVDCSLQLSISEMYRFQQTMVVHWSWISHVHCLSRSWKHWIGSAVWSNGTIQGISRTVSLNYWSLLIQLIWILLLSHILGLILQRLSARVGVVSGKDMAQVT